MTRATTRSRKPSRGRAEGVRRLPRRSPSITVIEGRRTGPRERAAEFWRYRRLLSYFGRRYIEKSFIRTWLGWVWIPLRPALDVGSRVLLFGGLLGVPSGDVPYLVFFLVGMSAWTFFDRTAYWATRSIELNRRVLRRMYVPRLTVLAAAAAPSALNYALYCVITAIVVFYYRFADGVFYVTFGLETFMAVAGLALVAALALSIGLWTSIFGAQARDVRFMLTYVLGFWFFLTPVIYPLSEVPESFRGVVELNPMTAPVELVKAGLLGGGDVPTTALAVTLGTIGVIALSGFWFFGRSETAALDSL
jgi:lipopolysaccharide transport system permease protein